MKKILFLTQYYPPEIGAPQNRLSELAIRFARDGFEVSVLTAMPNYPLMEIMEGYKRKIFMKERSGNVIIFRAGIFVSKKRSVFIRLMNYFSFVLTSFFVGLIKVGKTDLIICESPPLFLGISAYGLKITKRARLLFNVSDLWPESAEKLGLIRNKTLLSITRYLEEFIYKKSDLISGQTRGIVSDISRRNPGKRVFWLRNGVDPDLFNPDLSHKSLREEWNLNAEHFVAFYGGILGHAQGLEVILKAADLLRSEEKIRFVIAGTGPLESKLKELKESMKLSNVLFLPPYPKDKMQSVLASIDISIIPLKRISLFRGAIPSKIFETLAMRKPILLGVEGEAKELFIDTGKSGLSFIPEDDGDLAAKVKSLYGEKDLFSTAAENGYKYVRENFNRENIYREFLNFILE